LQDKEPKGIIPLENIQVREVAGDRGKPNCFELYSASNEVIKACKTDSEGKVIEGRSHCVICTLTALNQSYCWKRKVLNDVGTSHWQMRC